MTRILIVDDKEVNLTYLQALLEGEGCTVESARHGAEALVKARLSPPDLIISDLLMPVMDGYTLLRHWRFDARLKAVPFIVYTATYTDPEDERLALSLGADAFILKPADPEDFLVRVREVLAKTANVESSQPWVSADGESVQLKLYSETLIRKLEEKTLQLEAANRALQRDIADRERAELAQRRMAETQVAILNALPAHIALVDAQGVIVSVNEAWRRFATANVLQGPDFCVGHDYLAVCEQTTGDCSEAAKATAAGLRRVLQGESKEFAIEYPCHSPAEQRWFRLMVTPLNEEHRIGAVITHINITDRRLSENAVRESEQRLELATKSAHIGIWDWHVAENEMFWDPQMFALYGIGEGAFSGAYDAWQKGLHPGDRERAEAQIKVALAGARDFHSEFRVQWPNGQVRHIEAHGLVLRTEDGSPKRMIGVNWDITDRKLAEERIAEAARFAALSGEVGLALAEDDALRPMLQQCAVAIVKHLDAGFVRIWTLNEATATLELQASAGMCTHIDGPDARMPVGQFKIGLIAAERKPQFFNSIQDVFSVPEQEWARREGLTSFAGYPLVIDHQLLGAMEIFARCPLKDDLSTIANAVALGIQRKQVAERATWLASFPERNPSPIVELDLASGMINYANPQAIETFPKIQSMGFEHPSLSGLKEAEQYLVASKKGVVMREVSIGESIYLKTIHYIPETHRLRVYWNDISAQKHAEVALRKTQEQLNQSQKMDAIGKLAGGVAHDFNNQLNVMMGYAEMLAQRMTDPKLKRFAENIVTSAHRSGDLTKKLLAFSRKGQHQAVPMSIHVILTETAEMLERTIDKRIAIKTVLNAEEDVISGDPSQVQNAFLNLAVNARDAMPEGGEVEISTENVYLDSAGLAQHSGEAIPGDYLRICIRDTGTGMSDEVKRHLFEPFFTTKPVGKGTGMGLASVFGTVKNHKGLINVYSEVGHGTEFKIYLPMAEQTSAAAVTRAKLPKIAKNLRILLVEDEDILREMFREMLRLGEHDITEAENGRKALDVYRQDWKKIDLVILDMIMPEMNGPDTFRAMKKINPKIIALLSTGFSLNTEVQSVLDEGVRGFIQKPFMPDDILSLITKVMNEN